MQKHNITVEKKKKYAYQELPQPEKKPHHAAKKVPCLAKPTGSQ
jgi:hypothetical protein